MTNLVTAKPLHDSVIGKPVLAEEKTSSGIIIPGTANETATRYYRS